MTFCLTSFAFLIKNNLPETGVHLFLYITELNSRFLVSTLVQAKSTATTEE